MAKKVLIASYDIEIRDSIKKCLEGYDLEFIEAASGISLTYKSVELKPDLIIMSFSPANLAAYHKIKGGKPEKTRVPIILLLPSVISLPPGSKIKISDIVKENLLLELSKPSFKKELLTSAKTLMGDLKSAPKSAVKKEATAPLPSWDDIVESTSPKKDSKAAKKLPPEEEKAPPKKPDAEEKDVKETITIKTEPKKTPPGDIDKPREETIVQEDREKDAVLKAKSLIDDLLVGKPVDEKKYTLEKSKELIDEMLSHSDTLPKTVKQEDSPDEKPVEQPGKPDEGEGQKPAARKDEKDSAEKKESSGKPAKPVKNDVKGKPSGTKPETLIKDLLEGKPGSNKEDKPSEDTGQTENISYKQIEPVEIIRFEPDSAPKTKAPGQIEKTEESKKEKTREKKAPGLKTETLVEKLLQGKPEKEKPSQKKPPAKKDKTGTSSKKIILADDETDIRNGIKEALEMEGYSVTTVEDGEQLVETGKNLEPDLIIADVIMPGLSGYRAVGKLKTVDRFLKIPVIFMTARVKDEDMYETLKPKGPSYFMPKTFEMEELLDKVNSILKKKT